MTAGVKYVVGVAHCGNRSVQSWLQGQGFTAEICHLQQHGLRGPDIQALINTGNAVLAMRDPMLPVLSAAYLQDDTPSAIIKDLDELFALTWPSQIICVDLTSGFPVIGETSNAIKAAYLTPDVAKVKTLFAQTQPPSIASYDFFGAMQQRATAFKAKLAPLGYANLPWWA